LVGYKGIFSTETGPKSFDSSTEIKMTEIYEVRESEGKKLGCFALQDIKKGSIIIKEKPQIVDKGHTDIKICGAIDLILTDITPSFVHGLNEAFNNMAKTDQEEYMKLYDKFDNISSLPQILQSDMERRNELITKVTKSDQMAKIVKIYETNSFSSGVGIKISRFNHSCKPNATATIVYDDNHSGDGTPVIVANSNIKAGEEITVCYGVPGISSMGLRKRKTRLGEMWKTHFFVCSCNFCEEEDQKNDEDNTFEELINEIHSLNEERKALFQFNILSFLTYPPSKSRREVECYKELYKEGKKKKVQSIWLYFILNGGFEAAAYGYVNNRTEEFKTEAENFARTADKFEAILGSEIVTLGIPNFWKEKYQSFVSWQHRHMSGIIDY